MNISGIRPGAGFYDYSAQKVNQTANRPVEEVAPVSKPLERPAAEVDLSEEGIARARSRQTFGAYDYASQYRPGETFNMKGEDSDIKSLDVEKAVNDMKMDSVIQQYQFFVGDNQHRNGGADATGLENFSL